MADEEHDEGKGYWATEIRIKEGAEPLGDDKPAWLDDDYETVRTWVEYTADQLAFMERQAAQADLQETVALLPDAVADLSESVSDNSTELSDAIAELAQLVSDIDEKVSNL